MVVNKEFKISDKLNKFLDEEIKKADENIKSFDFDKHVEDFKSTVDEEIQELESNYKSLTDEEKEYLTWLKIRIKKYRKGMGSNENLCNMEG